MRVKNKVVIITGAGSGIGRETAILFAMHGAKVVVADVDEKGGNETVDQIKKILSEFEIETSKRIGVTRDLNKNLRFYIKDNKWVSKW